MATTSAFFYGTLMEPQIFYSVCYNDKNPPSAIKKLHTFRPAILHGHCRRRVKQVDYPGMTEDPDHSVRGAIVTGLTTANMAKLDTFEGPEYERKVVRPKLLVQVGDDKGQGNVEGDEVVAQTYIFLSKRALEDKEWDFAEFRRDKLQKWTRAGYVFEDCDLDQAASVSS